MNTPRVFLLAIALTTAAFAASTPAVAPPEPAVMTQELRGGVFMLTGRGGNIALFASEGGALLVDDQYKERTAMIVDAVKKLTPEPIRWVVNTHWHFDHTGGNENLGAQGVTFIAHDNVRRHLISGEHIEVFKMDQPPTKPIGLPAITFARNLTLHRGDETIEVMYAGVPAHTDGDSFVYFRQANVLHTGDVFVRYGWPFIDTPHGGSLDGTVRACEWLLSRPELTDDTLIIPGHGALARKADLALYTANLRTARDRIVALRQAGKKDEEIVAADPLAGIDLKETSIKKDVFVLLALEGMKQ
jgi:cyclase